MQSVHTDLNVVLLHSERAESAAVLNGKKEGGVRESCRAGGEGYLRYLWKCQGANNSRDNKRWILWVGICTDV